MKPLSYINCIVRLLTLIAAWLSITAPNLKKRRIIRHFFFLPLMICQIALFLIQAVYDGLFNTITAVIVVTILLAVLTAALVYDSNKQPKEFKDKVSLSKGGDKNN